MWLYQHLLMAGFAGFVMLMGIALAERIDNFNIKRLLALFASLAFPNLIDVDHYAGSWNDLIQCGFVTSWEQYFSGCLRLGVRGVFHQPWFFYPAFLFLGGGAIAYYRNGKKLESTILMGLCVGYMLHLALDGLFVFYYTT
jgi:hypothetical protein